MACEAADLLSEMGKKVTLLRKRIPRVYLIGGWRGFHEQQDAVADGYMAGLLA
jgi:hypothetical protein